jgi:hypothetical protein
VLVAKRYVVLRVGDRWRHRSGRVVEILHLHEGRVQAINVDSGRRTELRARSFLGGDYRLEQTDVWITEPDTDLRGH